ncbi:MAG: hypothetical protein ABH879_04685, partial [archaeon]
TDEILRPGREITKKTGKRATFQNCPLNAEITIQSQRNRRKRGFQDEAQNLNTLFPIKTVTEVFPWLKSEK